MRVRNVMVGVVIGTTAGVAISRTVRWRRTWGVDPEVSTKLLPGDDLVPVPSAVETRAMIIDAPPEAVWPWLVQMGYGRAGWYSYDAMDMRGKSADRIAPEWQSIAVGDVVPHSPGGGFAVRIVEPGRVLGLYSDTAIVEGQAQALTGPEVEGGEAAPAGLAASGALLTTMPNDFAASWVFVLEPLDGGRTRLIERFRLRVDGAGPSFRVFGPFIGFGVFMMLQRQMLGIKQRAERTVVVTPLPATPEKKRPATGNGHKPVETGPTEVLAAPAG
jgi:hypothetical protein